MKTYVHATIEVIDLSNEDIVTTSGVSSNDLYEQDPFSTNHVNTH